jgi:hypothetical protein
MCLQFGFVIFWQKDFGAKAAHKMLVKLTLGIVSWDSVTIDSSTRYYVTLSLAVTCAMLMRLHELYF